ncbi:hypothetical protein ACQEVF_57125 [Nonomuraea polychroma]|uniref:hypothetical protein n=1 Tax=Nonomuraea polychroma TaxID=46176 RepID=UPI003D8FCB79
MILPIISFPRHSRIDLTITVAEEPAFLLPRDMHGKYHAHYIRYLARKADAERRAVEQAAIQAGEGPHVLREDRTLEGKLNDELLGFLAQVFAFQPWDWCQVLEKHRYRHCWRDELLQIYLKSCAMWEADGLDNDSNGQRTQIRRWLRDHVDPIGKLVREEREADGEQRPSWRASAAETPLLAVLGARPSNVATVTRTLNGLHSFLNEATYSSTVTGRSIIQKYGYFGRFWIALAQCTVPVDEPFMIRVSERRPLEFGRTPFPKEGVYDDSPSRLRKWLGDVFGHPTSVRTPVVFRDAKSNHLNVRVPDDTIQINIARRKKLEPVCDLKQREEPVQPDDVVANEELYAYYSAKDDRSSLLWFLFPLRQTWPRRITLICIILWLLLALAALLILWLGPFDLDVKAMIPALLIPVSLSGGLLLVRSNSTLGGRINGKWHAITASLLLALWLVVIAYLIFGKSPKPIQWNCGNMADRSRIECIFFDGDS